MLPYIKLAYELKELMDNDPRFILLTEKEKAMENNEEVIDHSLNLGNNNTESESEIGQMEQVENGMDIEQS